MNFDTANLSGPRFVSLCFQLPKYDGALRFEMMRISRQQAEEASGSLTALAMDPDIEVG